MGGLLGNLDKMQVARARRAASCAGLYGMSVHEPAVSDVSTGWPEAQKRRGRVHGGRDRCHAKQRRLSEASELLDHARMHSASEMAETVEG